VLWIGVVRLAIKGYEVVRRHNIKIVPAVPSRNVTTDVAVPDIIISVMTNFFPDEGVHNVVSVVAPRATYFQIFVYLGSLARVVTVPISFDPVGIAGRVNTSTSPMLLDPAGIDGNVATSTFPMFVSPAAMLATSTVEGLDADGGIIIRPVSSTRTSFTSPVTVRPTITISSSPHSLQVKIILS
jgi:hypothetical protein